jgi:hypothetical protein
MLSAADALLQGLAELDPDLLRDALREANAVRAKRREELRQQQQRAVCRVRHEVLPEHSDRQIAHIIDALARGRRVVGLSPTLRAAVMSLLIFELNSLADLPGFETLRKFLQ